MQWWRSWKWSRRILSEVQKAPFILWKRLFRLEFTSDTRKGCCRSMANYLCSLKFPCVALYVRYIHTYTCMRTKEYGGWCVMSVLCQASIRHGMGPRGSALICGYTSYHRQLESCLADLKKKEVLVCLKICFLLFIVSHCCFLIVITLILLEQQRWTKIVAMWYTWANML